MAITPSLTIDLAALVIAVMALVVNAPWLKKAIELGTQRQDLALAELKNRIKDRISNPELMATHSLRALAISIEQRYRCAVITDKLIGEAIRSAAFEFEEEHKGPALVSRLQILNTALVTFDKEGPQLLSIASVDRLSAYRLSQPILLTMLFGLLFFLAALDAFVHWPLIFWPIMGAVLCLLWVVVVANRRITRFWEGKTTDVEHPPHALLDFFLVKLLSNTRKAELFWHVQWAPFWEAGYFFFPAQEFFQMHEHRYLTAKDLRAKILELEENLIQANARNADLQPHYAELAAVYRKLWNITGDAGYKARAHACLSTSNADHLSLLAEINQQHRSSLAELEKSFVEQQRKFYTAMSRRDTDPAQLEQLNNIINAARVLLQKTGDQKYRRIEQEFMAMLEKYNSTGKFFNCDGR